MNYSKKIICLIILSALLVCGCLNLTQKPNKKINYYTLEYDPPETENLKALPFVIYIERFNVAPPYDSTRIIYSQKKFIRDAYIYHKWMANPGDFVTYYLTRDIKCSSLFRTAFSSNSSYSSTYIINGTVDEFFEQDDNDIWKAVLSINITLMSKNEPDISKSVLMQKQYSAIEPCSRKNPQSLAEAMSKAMANISGRIIRDVYKCIEDKK